MGMESLMEADVEEGDEIKCLVSMLMRNAGALRFCPFYATCQSANMLVMLLMPGNMPDLAAIPASV
jgi:hypothetical protein